MTTGAAPTTKFPPLTEAQQALAAKWEGLCKRLARDATPREDLQDILQSAAQLALVHAARTFDPTTINQVGRPARFSTYAWSACRRAVNTTLAKELARESRIEETEFTQDLLGREPEPGQECQSDGFGSLQAAVLSLPPVLRAAVEKAYAGGDAPSLSAGDKERLAAALARLRADVVPSAVADGYGEGRESARPWEAAEEAFLCRYFTNKPMTGPRAREHYIDAGRRLGRPARSVKRKLLRLVALGAFERRGKRRWRHRKKNRRQADQPTEG